MPGVSEQSASEDLIIDGYHGRLETFDVDGGWMVSFETFTVDFDWAPMCKGMPNDQCQSPHFGYVFEGRLGFKFDDHDETFVAGEAFYASPGHTPVQYAGSKVLGFSKVDEARHLIDNCWKNLGDMADDPTKLSLKSIAAALASRT